MEPQALWKKLAILRQPYLDRALDCAAVTIPHLVVDRTHSKGQTLPKPFTSFGAAGVNNLASKLSLSLFPVNAPAFQYDLVPQAFQDFDASQKAELEKAFREREALITRDIEARGHRSAIYESLRQLLVAGTCVLYSPDEGRPKVFSLPEFVLDIDGKGVLRDLLITQEISTDNLPEGTKTLDTESVHRDGYRNLITTIHREAEGSKGEEPTFSISQEITGTDHVEKKQTGVPLSRLPFKPLLLNRIPGESYGRSFVEDHLGNLLTLENLAQATVEATAAMSTTIYLVDPMSSTNLRQLQKAKNGDFVAGRATDVSVLGTNKALDLRAAQEFINALSRQIQAAFLMASSVQRDGERVTAVEIQSLIRELEGALGGVYSNLTYELQIPLIQLTEARLIEEERLENLDAYGDSVSVRIVTGVESLGRSQELGRLQTAASVLQGIFGPEKAAAMLDPRNTSIRVLVAAGLDPDDYALSEEQVQGNAQQEQLQQAVSDLGPSFVREVGASSRNPTA
jgi:hypothetical protein